MKTWEYWEYSARHFLEFPLRKCPALEIPPGNPSLEATIRSLREPLPGQLPSTGTIYFA